jgi:2'-5' RNA ligase
MDLRLFVALELPEPVRRRLGALQAQLREAAGARAGEVKWVSPDAVHLTLQFLGAVPEERLPLVNDAVSAAAAGAAPIALEARGAGGFPSARRPRVLWAGIGGDLAALGALAAALGERLAPLGYAPEDRPFSPHLTLGRAREGRGAPGLAGVLAGVAGWTGPSWRATEVCVFRSHLSPSGARYEALLRAPLGVARTPD